MKKKEYLLKKLLEIVNNVKIHNKCSDKFRVDFGFTESDEIGGAVFECLYKYGKVVGIKAQLEYIIIKFEFNKYLCLNEKCKYYDEGNRENLMDNCSVQCIDNKSSYDIDKIEKDCRFLEMNGKSNVCNLNLKERGLTFEEVDENEG